MDISVYEVMKSGGMTAGSTCYFDFDRSSGGYSGIMFEKGFFFLLVINGTARLSDIYGNYDLRCGKLVVLTPSTTSSIGDFDADFSLKIVYIVPSYFDSLPYLRILTVFLTGSRCIIRWQGISAITGFPCLILKMGGSLI